ncbi:hypothetical protein Hypma_003502 [Hypsizygus marmoreus]|uniref:Uncharacterized protein n=1 Tax=Hypsizygus marmoreus TaxID=39966 RepID=A0A369J1Q6_HYPMA|nr:hypothetical protein Hypma_003502 [Hypsizygus marmoreus]
MEVEVRGGAGYFTSPFRRSRFASGESRSLLNWKLGTSDGQGDVRYCKISLIYLCLSVALAWLGGSGREGEGYAVTVTAIASPASHLLFFFTLRASCSCIRMSSVPRLEIWGVDVMDVVPRQKQTFPVDLDLETGCVYTEDDDQLENPTLYFQRPAMSTFLFALTGLRTLPHMHLHPGGDSCSVFFFLACSIPEQLSTLESFVFRIALWGSPIQEFPPNTRLFSILGDSNIFQWLGYSKT